MRGDKGERERETEPEPPLYCDYIYICSDYTIEMSCIKTYR